MQVQRRHRKTGKPKGAPKGNQNALKHGIYSECINAEEEAATEAMAEDKSGDELALARVRLKKLIKRQRRCPPEDWLGYERAITHYIRIIVWLTHKNALLGRGQRTGYLTVLEIINQLNKEQNVR